MTKKSLVLVVVTALALGVVVNGAVSFGCGVDDGGLPPDAADAGPGPLLFDRGVAADSPSSPCRETGPLRAFSFNPTDWTPEQTRRAAYEWIQSLDCPLPAPEAADFLLAAEVDSFARVARSHLRAQSPGCFVAWERSEIVDPVVALRECPLRFPQSFPIGGTWQEYADLWLLARTFSDFQESQNNESLSFALREVLAAIVSVSAFSWSMPWAPSGSPDLYSELIEAMAASWADDEFERIEMRSGMCESLAAGDISLATGEDGGFGLSSATSYHAASHPRCFDFAMHVDGIDGLLDSLRYWLRSADAYACDSGCVSEWRRIEVRLVSERERMCGRHGSARVGPGP